MFWSRHVASWGAARENGDSIWPIAGEPRPAVLKWGGMNPAPSKLLAALTRAWQAVARAFTPASDSRASQQYGADTTLFGGSTQLPRERPGRDGGKNEFWVPGDSTDFADMDAERDARDRR